MSHSEPEVRIISRIGAKPHAREKGLRVLVGGPCAEHDFARPILPRNAPGRRHQGGRDALTPMGVVDADVVEIKALGFQAEGRLQPVQQGEPRITRAQLVGGGDEHGLARRAHGPHQETAKPVRIDLGLAIFGIKGGVEVLHLRVEARQYIEVRGFGPPHLDLRRQSAA